MLLTDARSDIKDTFSACMYGISTAMAPEFCWKRKEDKDRYWRPITCPPGTFRKYRKCIKNCNDGEEYKNGQCRKPCQAGYKSIKRGRFCRNKKNFWNKYPREGREPAKSFPTCKEGYEAQGRRCKKSCTWGK